MNTYDPNKFINALSQKTNNRPIPICPYCGGHQFTTTDSMATIMINKETGINLGPYIPAGMVVCEKCGHIEFFALRALGLMTDKDEQIDGEKK